MKNIQNTHSPKSPNKIKTFNKLKIMQLKSSNADWNTKILELTTSVDKHDPDVCIVSESNTEINNADKILIVCSNQAKQDIC